MDDVPSEAQELALSVPWSTAIADLASRGWAYAGNAIETALIEAVDSDQRREWVLRSGQEGVARYESLNAYMALADALPIVRALAERLTATLSEAAYRSRLPAPPGFNEVTWTRYPARSGHITAHRDPPAYGGVTAIFTLRGRAPFRITDDGGAAHEWETAPGQCVLLRGDGWPAAGSRCPVHEAMAPPRANAPS